MLKRLLISGMLAIGLSAQAEKITIGDFEKGANTFEGIVVDKSVGKDSSASAKIFNDKKWVTVKKKLNLEKELKELTFDIKSDGPDSIAVRAVDSTRQNFQQRFPIKNDGSWKQIKITNFARGHIFGGAGDKKIHSPVTELQIILEKKGTVWVDNVEIKLADKLLPSAAKKKQLLAAAETFKIADFENNSGFSDGIKIAKGEGRNGSKAGKISKTADKKWESAGKDFKNLKKDFLQVSYWVKSNDANNLAVRFVDATGQNFQQRIPIDPNGKWQEVVITKFNQGQSWGGAKDKKWHAPAKKMTFILERDGTVLIDDIEAKLASKKLSANLEINQNQLGNIYLTTDKKVLPLETLGDEISWVIWDVDHKEVKNGTSKAQNGKVNLQLPELNGYYLMKLTAKKGGEVIAEKYTSYAVITPYKVKDHTNAPWGVMTHFAQGMQEDIMPLLVKAGIVSIRDEHYWKKVEEVKGKYVFSEKSNLYMAEAKKNNLDPLIAMTFGNPHYDHKQGPSTQAGYEGYANYGKAILKQYGKQIRWLEIWNEYNGSWCPPEAKKDRPKYYAEMIKVAYKAIKEVRPDVKVLGCACVLIPMPYIEGIFKHGGIDYMDGIVIHPYRKKPEGVDKEVADLAELIRKYNQGKDKPIWVTETGRIDKSEYDWEKGKKMQERGRFNGAQYLPRQYTLLLSQPTVDKIYWYLCSDHMMFTSMGLVRRPNDPMGRYAVGPQYVTYATLIRQIDGKKFVEREANSQYTRAYVMKFADKKGETVRVCWATFPSKIEVTSSEPFTVVDMVGRENKVTPTNGKAIVNLNKSTVYLKGNIQQINEIEPKEKIIASSVDDYGKTQGLNNWYYGYIDVKNAPSEFKEMEIVETMWGENWRGPQKYLALNGGGGHPGNGIWAVKRWQSPFEGKVEISGICNRDKRGNGIDFIILNDGKEIFKQRVGGPNNPEKITIKVASDIKKDSRIDFCISPGGNTNYDITSYDIMVKTRNN